MSGRLVLILSVGILIRFLYVFGMDPFLHWDEAPQVYMAQQIAAGAIHPLVYFQLPYIGALEQYPLALLMLLIGDSVSTVNVFFFILSLLSLGIAYLLYRAIFPPPWSYLALSFFALCPPVLLHFSLQAWSFGSLILFETAILWLLLSHQSQMNSKSFLFVLGLLGGLSMYDNILMACPLAFCAWIIYTSSSWRGLSVFLSALLVGYSPMIYFNLVNEFVSYRILAAKFLGVSQKMVDDHGVFAAIAHGGFNKITGQGPKSDFGIFLSFPPFSSMGEFYLQLVASLVFISIILVFVLSLSPRIYNRTGTLFQFSPRTRRGLFFCIGATVVVTFSTVRYMIALVPLIPIVLCEGLAICRKYNRRVMEICTLGLILYLTIGHVKVIAQEYRDPYSQVYQILEKNHLAYGYGSYHFQSYTAFLSKGRIKISPQIGPMYIDKIPSFSQAVDQADDVFYILPEGFSLDYLDKNDIRYESERVDGWVVIWNLSKRVFPKELLSPEELARDDGYMRWSYRENPLVLNPYRGGH